MSDSSGASMGLTVILSYEDDKYFFEPFFMSEELNGVHGLGGSPPVIPTGFKEEDSYLKVKNDIKRGLLPGDSGLGGQYYVVLNGSTCGVHQGWHLTILAAQTVHDMVRPSHFEVIPASSMSPHKEQTFYWVVTNGLHPGIFPGIDDARRAGSDMNQSWKAFINIEHACMSFCQGILG
ncbi:hypothetical protein ARMGADRAFT_1038425 [Armillaria gallica]|uniref:Uncharacterized protein n=1 Tax=Armillaria gallica TaxID=47427 RepID=A0A2H3CTY2_ARMGA|nr:hypothetical protein ARMGADRAFT_1038425 [Armillaria gallica]